MQKHQFLLQRAKLTRTKKDKRTKKGQSPIFPDVSWLSGNNSFKNKKVLMIKLTLEEINDKYLTNHSKLSLLPSYCWFLTLDIRYTRAEKRGCWLFVVVLLLFCLVWFIFFWTISLLSLPFVVYLSNKFHWLMEICILGILTFLHRLLIAGGISYLSLKKTSAINLLTAWVVRSLLKALSGPYAIFFQIRARF